MSLFQFLRILWAYRLVVVASVIGSFLLAFAFAQIAKPRYEAQARVMLDVVKPDPVTGQVMSTAFLKAYTKTQIQLIKDYQVAGRVVGDLGWAKDPAILSSYRSRDKGTDLDFNRWAAQQIVDGTEASLIEGSNILEITYSSSSPQRAKDVVNALRGAYLDLTLSARRETARRNAEWYENQAQKLKDLLLRAEQARADFERQTGIILQENDVDLDSARLNALAGAAAGPTILPTAGTSSTSAMQLAEADAAIAQASKTLGPNHPQLIEMRRRREFLATQAANESRGNGSAGAAAAGAARAAGALLEQQKAKVMGQREKVEQLRLLREDANLRREQYNQAMARAAQLRQEADVAVSGVTPLGAAVASQSPVFPNKALIITASIPAGAGFGLVLALLLEFVGRRIRGSDDLSQVAGAPVLAVIQSRGARGKSPLAFLPRLPASIRPHARPASG